MSEQFCCERSGNPCGTDTLAKGEKCCQRCRLWQALEGVCENEDVVRELAAKVLPDDQVNGDTWSVPGIPDVVESLVQEIERLRAEVESSRETARWLLPFLVNEPHHLSTAVERWPWLKEQGDE